MPRFLLSVLFIIVGFQFAVSQNNIPLPEHPRPDWQRDQWLNLNGDWSFRFDKDDVGLKENWASGKVPFPLTIKVPFPWGSPLSGVKDEADIAWYQRSITIPKEWKNKRVFVVIGASDYKTTVWLDGKELGSFEGGYVPFEFELATNKAGKAQKLVVRVDDKRRDYALYGKQGYGNARGFWQTVYLEARAKDYVETTHFTPDIDKAKVKVVATLAQPASEDLTLKLSVKDIERVVSQSIKKGETQVDFEVAMPNFKLWTLDKPHLYHATLSLAPNASNNMVSSDEVKSYFGMRKISVVNLPNTNFPYVALNNEPIYLQLTLDQSYHPEGYYTFPTDEFMKNEIKLAKDIGLNGIRTHIKIDVPRKLYWADKLGLLVMSDLPNFWGQPDSQARAESERTLPQLIKRDYNHPAIFSWIIFNETWGLRTKVEENGKKVDKYLPETQKWVAEMYRKAKALDPTRLVEDNSICCGAGHTETDINSWHEYLPGYAWESHLKNLTTKVATDPQFNFEKGYQLKPNTPNINSEFGNVWGYDGSSGDVDYTWDYHRAVNTYRKYPLVSGWLYTEHHDVINEWNGYWKYDRTQKFTGLEEMVAGMSLNDLHAPIMITTGQDISYSVRPTEVVQVPLTISAMTGRNDLGNELTLKATLRGIDALGHEKQWQQFAIKVPYKPWIQQALDPMYVIMPAEKAMAILELVLEDNKGNIISRNFNTYVVETNLPAETTHNGQKMRLLTIDPKNFTDAKWSVKQWNVLDGLKVNGTGNGYFEYKIKLPSDLKMSDIVNGSLVMEASAKQLFGKDRDNAAKMDGDYMLGGGTADNSRNPNAYPQTDETKFPSEVKISFNGAAAGSFPLPDDPADHRGVLSWHYQPQNRKLKEAGSYGYRVEAAIPKEALEKALQTGELVVRLAVEGNGGLAIYGEKFGRYPMNPTIVLKTK